MARATGSRVDATQPGEMERRMTATFRGWPSGRRSALELQGGLQHASSKHGSG